MVDTSDRYNQAFKLESIIMKKRFVAAAAVVVLTAATSIYMVHSASDDHSVFADILHEGSEIFSTEVEDTTENEELAISSESDEIVIPDDAARYGSININNSSSSAISAHDADGQSYTIDSSEEVNYSDPLILDNLGESSDFEVSGSNFYYGIKGDSIDSVTVNPQDGITVSGNDYNYDLSFQMGAEGNKVSFSGAGNGELNIARDNSQLLVNSKFVFGDMVVNSNGKEYHYQLNAMSCIIKADGTVLHKDGTEVSTSSDSVAAVDKAALAENVFHTIEPALLVKGSSSTISRAAELINDYVYDNESQAAAFANDTAISEYYEYFGENGVLSFTITIFANGHHARIATSDGEVHDYIYEAQEGAHCYPVFSFG